MCLIGPIYHVTVCLSVSQFHRSNISITDLACILFFSDPTICVTHNNDFVIVCLTPVFLRNVLVSNNNVKASRCEVNSPPNRYQRIFELGHSTHLLHL